MKQTSKATLLIPKSTCKRNVCPSLYLILTPFLNPHVTIDASPKHPVVFCHGLLGFDQVSIGPAIAPLQFNHWRGIKEVLEASGSEVLITRVPATSSPVDRAHVLAEAIEQTYPGRAVHLIGKYSHVRFLTKS